MSVQNNNSHSHARSSSNASLTAATLQQSALKPFRPSHRHSQSTVPSRPLLINSAYYNHSPALKSNVNVVVRVNSSSNSAQNSDASSNYQKTRPLSSQVYPDSIITISKPFNSIYVNSPTLSLHYTFDKVLCNYASSSSSLLPSQLTEQEEESQLLNYLASSVPKLTLGHDITLIFNINRESHDPSPQSQHISSQPCRESSSQNREGNSHVSSGSIYNSCNNNCNLDKHGRNNDHAQLGDLSTNLKHLSENTNKNNNSQSTNFETTCSADDDIIWETGLVEKYCKVLFCHLETNHSFSRSVVDSLSSSSSQEISSNLEKSFPESTSSAPSGSGIPIRSSQIKKPSTLNNFNFPSSANGTSGPAVYNNTPNNINNPNIRQSTIALSRKYADNNNKNNNIQNGNTSCLSGVKLNSKLPPSNSLNRLSVVGDNPTTFAVSVLRFQLLNPNPDFTEQNQEDIYAIDLLKPKFSTENGNQSNSYGQVVKLCFSEHTSEIPAAASSSSTASRRPRSLYGSTSSLPLYSTAISTQPAVKNTSSVITNLTESVVENHAQFSHLLNLYPSSCHSLSDVDINTYSKGPIITQLKIYSQNSPTAELSPSNHISTLSFVSNARSYSSNGTKEATHDDDSFGAALQQLLGKMSEQIYTQSDISLSTTTTTTENYQKIPTSSLPVAKNTAGVRRSNSNASVTSRVYTGALGRNNSVSSISSTNSTRRLSYVPQTKPFNPHEFSGNGRPLSTSFERSISRLSISSSSDLPDENASPAYKCLKSILYRSSTAASFTTYFVTSLGGIGDSLLSPTNASFGAPSHNGSQNKSPNQSSGDIDSTMSFAVKHERGLFDDLENAYLVNPFKSFKKKTIHRSNINSRRQSYSSAISNRSSIISTKSFESQQNTPELQDNVIENDLEDYNNGSSEVNSPSIPLEPVVSMGTAITTPSNPPSPIMENEELADSQQSSSSNSYNNAAPNGPRRERNFSSSSYSSAGSISPSSPANNANTSLNSCCSSVLTNMLKSRTVQSFNRPLSSMSDSSTAVEDYSSGSISLGNHGSSSATITDRAANGEISPIETSENSYTYSGSDNPQLNSGFKFQSSGEESNLDNKIIIRLEKQMLKLKKINNSLMAKIKDQDEELNDLKEINIDLLDMVEKYEAQVSELLANTSSHNMSSHHTEKDTGLSEKEKNDYEDTIFNLKAQNSKLSSEISMLRIAHKSQTQEIQFLTKKYNQATEDLKKERMNNESKSHITGDSDMSLSPNNSSSVNDKKRKPSDTRSLGAASPINTSSVMEQNGGGDRNNKNEKVSTNFRSLSLASSFQKMATSQQSLEEAEDNFDNDGNNNNNLSGKSVIRKRKFQRRSVSIPLSLKPFDEAVLSEEQQNSNDASSVKDKHFNTAGDRRSNGHLYYSFNFFPPTNATTTSLNNNVN